jgi:hypothetical protein
VSIEIGASCTLRLSEKEVDTLRRLLFDASNGVGAVRNQKAELAATMAAVGFVEIK